MGAISDWQELHSVPQLGGFFSLTFFFEELGKKKPFCNFIDILNWNIFLMGRFNCMESKQVLVYLWWWEVVLFKNNEIFWQFQEDQFLEFDFFSHQQSCSGSFWILVNIKLTSFWCILFELPPVFNALIQKLVLCLCPCKGDCFCIWQQLLLWQCPSVPLTISFFEPNILWFMDQIHTEPPHWWEWWLPWFS